MIYLEKENQLTFSAQTRMKTKGEMFSLETTSSNDVDARYNVTSGERKIAEEAKSDKDKTLYATSKSGVIMVKNRKKEEIELCLEVTVQGQVEAKEFKNDVGKVIEKPGSDVFNPINTITWNIKIPASDNKELEFGYVVKHLENHQGVQFGGKPSQPSLFGGKPTRQGEFGGFGQANAFGN